MRLRQCLPLVGVHPDAVQRPLRRRPVGYLGQPPVARLATGGEHHVRPLIQRLRRRRRPPLRVGEGHVQPPRMEGRHHRDVRIRRLRPRLKTPGKQHHRRNQVGAVHPRYRPAPAHPRRQHPRQVPGLILVEHQPHRIGQRLRKELIHPDEVHIRILHRRLRRRLTQRKTHRHNDVVVVLGKLGDVVGIVGAVLRLNVVRFTAILLHHRLDTFPGTLVEAAVIHLPHIRHQPDAQPFTFSRSRRRRSGFFGRLFGWLLSGFLGSRRLFGSRWFFGRLFGSCRLLSRFLGSCRLFGWSRRGRWRCLGAASGQHQGENDGQNDQPPSLFTRHSVSLLLQVMARKQDSLC